MDRDLGELLLVGFSGTEVDGNLELERLLCEARVGSVLLFGRNVVNQIQVRGLTTAIRERAMACAGRAPLVAVDAEGGRVMRLGAAAGYDPTFSAEELGSANDLALTELEARRIGERLRATGIRWNLAPVVDVGYNPANPVITAWGRSFGADPELVTAQARVWIRGMHAAGVITTIKHFPGHGSSFADSHLGFVDVTDTASRSLELAPYRALLREGLVDSIMTAHVFNRRLDWRYPATLSRPTVTGLLRRTLDYDGLVVADDLRMGAIEQQYGVAAAAVLAVRAGVDVLILAQDRMLDGRAASAVALAELGQALGDGRLRSAQVATALDRVRRFKMRAAELAR
ncbi:MAG: glycoside hydrolase family 3 protein [Candidatus Rokubacteria bacterium]|nr:glycoside hydrolase family 3 protein [Candidatus Rokubacteria bacterium]